MLQRVAWDTIIAAKRIRQEVVLDIAVMRCKNWRGKTERIRITCEKAKDDYWEIGNDGSRYRDFGMQESITSKNCGRRARGLQPAQV